MAKETNNDLVLAFLQMAHVMKRNRLYIKLESVVLPCLEIAADTLHGEEKPLQKQGKFLYPIAQYN